MQRSTLGFYVEWKHAASPNMPINQQCSDLQQVDKGIAGNAESLAMQSMHIENHRNHRTV
jgi:hypothetical protein